ncbi:MAG: mcr, partial [Actinomycetia bacterium]|nr:mcr [Actinomycetes bacterium]
MAGPLAGVRVVELAGIGAAPFAAMLLADMGADVVRVDRVQSVPAEPGPTPGWDVPLRGRRRIAVDLRHPAGPGVVLDLVAGADALLEGFRPGVAERLGIGPGPCLERNPRLVYGRMTGWGQEGPYAQAAGHDLNYIALAGALAHLGRAGQPPTPPLNLLGDYAGGAMFLVFGMACALFEARSSGEGQVVDAAMVDGVASLMAMWWGFSQVGRFDEANRGGHYFDTGAHFFEVYECADGAHVSVAAIEPQFYAELLDRLGLGGDPLFEVQRDPAAWPAQKARLAEVFATRTRAEWCEVLEGTDACFAPVLTMSEAARHPHNVARATFVDVDGIRQPAPAPRFSRTVPALGRPPAVA